MVCSCNADFKKLKSWELACVPYNSHFHEVYDVIIKVLAKANGPDIKLCSIGLVLTIIVILLLVSCFLPQQRFFLCLALIYIVPLGTNSSATSVPLPITSIPLQLDTTQVLLKLWNICNIKSPQSRICIWQRQRFHWHLELGRVEWSTSEDAQKQDKVGLVSKQSHKSKCPLVFNSPKHGYSAHWFG